MVIYISKQIILLHRVKPEEKLKMTVRKQSPNKKSIEIYKSDYEFIDENIRRTPIGYVSFADAIRELIRIQKFCKENAIDVSKREV